MSFYLVLRTINMSSSPIKGEALGVENYIYPTKKRPTETFDQEKYILSSFDSWYNIFTHTFIHQLFGLKKNKNQGYH